MQVRSATAALHTAYNLALHATKIWQGGGEECLSSMLSTLAPPITPQLALEQLVHSCRSRAESPRPALVAEGPS